MTVGPNEQPNSDQFRLPSPRPKTDDQVSAYIRQGLSLAKEIEATLSQPSVPDPSLLSIDLDSPSFNCQPDSPSPRTNSPTITTEIQSTVLEQLPQAVEATNETSWATVWLRRGIQKYEQADYAGAHDNFKQALLKQPALASALNGIGSVLYQQKDFVNAVVVYNQAIDYAPQSAQIYCNLGSTLYQMQSFDEAALAYQQAIYFNPYLQVAYYGLGVTHFQIGFQEEAVTAFEQATQLNIRHADSFLGLAAALHLIGEYQNAKAALCQAMQLDALYIEVYLRFQNILLL